MKSIDESIRLIDNCFKDLPSEYRNSEVLLSCFYEGKIHDIKYNPKTKEISEPLPDINMLYVLPYPIHKPVTIEFEEWKCSSRHVHLLFYPEGDDTTNRIAHHALH